MAPPAKRRRAPALTRQGRSENTVSEAAVVDDSLVQAGDSRGSWAVAS